MAGTPLGSLNSGKTSSSFPGSDRDADSAFFTGNRCGTDSILLISLATSKDEHENQAQ